MESLVSSVLEGSEGFMSFAGSKGKEAASEGASLSDEDEIYKDPSFWNAVDQLEKTFKKPVHQSTPNFDLGISLSADDHADEDFNLNEAFSAHAFPAAQTPAAQTAVPQTDAAPASHSSPASKDSAVSSRTRSSASPLQREVEVAVDVGRVSKLKRKEVAEPSKQEKREMPKRNKGLPPAFKSPFCIRHIDVLKALTSTEKVLCDWAFSRFDGDRERDPKKREVAYQDDHFSINRHVFQSFSYDAEISIQMIDLWSYILNLDEERRDATSVPRFFLSIVTPELFEPKFYNDFKAMAKRDIDKSTHLDICLAKLVFIPVSIQISKYVFLVCINFNTSTVDIIDIMKNPPHVDQYAKIAKKLVKTISKFLKEIGSVNYNSLLKFNVKYIEMSWRYESGDFSPNDSGIYCMRHMETYHGNAKEFDIGFKKPHNIFGKKLRAKYAASILSFKSNVLRIYIQQKAEEFAKS